MIFHFHTKKSRLAIFTKYLYKTHKRIHIRMKWLNYMPTSITSHTYWKCFIVTIIVVLAAVFFYIHSFVLSTYYSVLNNDWTKEISKNNIKNLYFYLDYKKIRNRKIQIRVLIFFLFAANFFYISRAYAWMSRFCSVTIS